MNTQNRRLLITGGAIGLALGLVFGGLTFADGPVLLHADVRRPDPGQDSDVTAFVDAPSDTARGAALYEAFRLNDALFREKRNEARRLSDARRHAVLSQARQNELAIAAIIIIGSAVAITCGAAAPTQR